MTSLTIDQPPYASTDADITRLLRDVAKIIPPLWPLEDFVAVNPFVGLSDTTFLEARGQLRAVRDCELLASEAYFAARLASGRITQADVEKAYLLSWRSYPDWYDQLSADEVVAIVKDTATESRQAERRYHTVADLVDQQDGSHWSSHIINDITRHCSAHYDRGQAAWASPWRDRSLYSAWKVASRLSRRMDMLGLRGFRSIVASLPDDPVHAVERLLVDLELPAAHRGPWLACEIMSVAGWASYIKYHQQQQAIDGCGGDLCGLLAMRLAYDLALSETRNDRASIHGRMHPDDSPSADPVTSPDKPPVQVLARYVMQQAAEIAYQRSLLGSIRPRHAEPAPTRRKAMQMVFCIDVRSELMRRHLEAQSGSIETFGFAGFFGLPLQYVRLGESQGAAQCPVLLRPAFSVHERAQRGDTGVESKIVRRRRLLRHGRKAWKAFQTSAISCFSFVESIGLAYALKMLTDSFRWTRPVASTEGDGLLLQQHAELAPAAGDLPITQRVDLAESLLRNLGLTDGFARLVVLCGHGADVVNNPYKAGLECGACGGHSGEPNARVAAAILNQPAVRRSLADRGINIPDDTRFSAAVHNTTKDEIRFYDTDCLPDTHRKDLDQARRWTRQAGAHCRIERGRRLADASSDADIQRRTRDWSELRPEWGLANNAAFIVAPRSRTLNVNLDGRVFLHNYAADRDPDLKILELIMTAPMVVASWINLQYYASAVDNRAFGSGNKAIHNVVGQFGILQGNGGDLMTGLPWQSIHDGTRFQHEPLRLMVVIDASRQAVQQIIHKHQVVRDLVTNGWISLAVLEGRRCYRWLGDDRWLNEDSTAEADAEPEPDHDTLCATGAEQ